jgi:hypothetical protein
MRLLEHVSVWGDGLYDAGAEAFPHAMQWALALGVPLRVVIGAARPPRGQPGARLTDAPPVYRTDGAGSDCPSLVETMKAWSAACTDLGIVLETSLWLGGIDTGISRLLRPCGLCVIAERQYRLFHQALISCSGHSAAIALLFVAPRGRALRRMVILYEHMNPSAAYLESAIHLNPTLELRPLIVTVARTARDAALKRSHAEGVCASLDVPAEFVTIVGPDPHAALGRLVEAVEGSHLVIERSDGAGWPQLHGDWLAPWCGLSEALNILALPENVQLGVPHRHRPSPDRSGAPRVQPFAPLGPET